MDWILEYWIQALFAGILAGMAFMMRQLNARIKQERAENEAIKTAMIAILHDRLFQCCRVHIKNGFIPLGEAETVLDNLKLLYETYSALGGNGTGTELYTRTRKLPLKAEAAEQKKSKEDNCYVQHT